MPTRARRGERERGPRRASGRTSIPARDERTSVHDGTVSTRARLRRSLTRRFPRRVPFGRRTRRRRRLGTPLRRRGGPSSDAASRGATRRAFRPPSPPRTARSLARARTETSRAPPRRRPRRRRASPGKRCVGGRDGNGAWVSRRWSGGGRTRRGRGDARNRGVAVNLGSLAPFAIRAPLRAVRVLGHPLGVDASVYVQAERHARFHDHLLARIAVVRRVRAGGDAARDAAARARATGRRGRTDARRRRWRREGGHRDRTPTRVAPRAVRAGVDERRDDRRHRRLATTRSSLLHSRRRARAPWRRPDPRFPTPWRGFARERARRPRRTRARRTVPRRVDVPPRTPASPRVRTTPPRTTIRSSAPPPPPPNDR